MGAETSAFQDLELEDELQLTGEHGWTLHDGLTREGTRVSVFVHGKATANVELVQHAAKHLKTLRHPSILKFLGLTKASHGLMLVTEHATPLEIAIETLSAAEIAAGLYNIIEALVFLHDTGGMCHNNICISSVYVSDDGGWRLGGVEHLCRFSEATTDFLQNCKALRCETALAPEEMEKKGQNAVEYGHARDAFAFGSMAEQLLELLQDLGDMMKTFEMRIQDEFLHPDPRQRPKLHTLLNDQLFRNEFLEILNFLSHITVKTEEEKGAFFKSVARKLYQLPSPLVATRLARPLLSRFVLLDPTAEKSLIPHLLTPCTDKIRGPYREDQVNPLLPTSQFRQHIIPELFKIFHVRDAHIRLVLLSRFSSYVQVFDKISLQKVILPQVLQGLRDTNDDLVKASLLALADLVPILGGDIIIGTRRLKLFSEGKPKFANNTGVQNGPSQGRPYTLEKINRQASAIKTTNPDKVIEKRTFKDQAKEKERERRKEEARQRNEERRKKREERLRNQRNISKAEDTVSETSDLTSVTSESMAPSEASRDVGDSHDIVIHNEKTEWSDWEADGPADDEEDIDREIEEELNAMQTTLSPTKVETSLTPSPTIDVPLIKVEWSEADKIVSQKSQTVEIEDKGHGVLKLKSKSKSQSPKKAMPSESEWGDTESWGFTGEPNSTQHVASANGQRSPMRSQVRGNDAEMTFSNQASEWGNEWEQIELSPSAKPSSPTKSPEHKLREKRSSKLKLKTSKSNSESNVSSNKTIQQPKPKQSTQDPGAEFEIHSIKVKKKDEQQMRSLDFFSDMEPVLKTTNPLAELIERAAEMAPKAPATKNTQIKTTTNTSLSFEVLDTADTDADGWGDEGWGDPDDVLAEDDLAT